MGAKQNSSNAIHFDSWLIVNNCSYNRMVPQTLNMVDVVLRSIRVYKVQKSGELCDKLEKDVNLICEYDPQGVNLKLYTGKSNE